MFAFVLLKVYNKGKHIQKGGTLMNETVNMEQKEKIDLIESMMFVFFNGRTKEEAERFIAVNYQDAVKRSHKLGMVKKRKGRNRFNGVPVRITG
jgi:hypothetical protein